MELFLTQRKVEKIDMSQNAIGGSLTLRDLVKSTGEIDFHDSFTSIQILPFSDASNKGWGASCQGITTRVDGLQWRNFST